MLLKIWFFLSKTIKKKDYEKIILTLFLFFGLYIQNSSFADATRYFCTETWSNRQTLSIQEKTLVMEHNQDARLVAKSQRVAKKNVRKMKMRQHQVLDKKMLHKKLCKH